MSMLRRRSLVKAILVPSGDHAGSASTPGLGASACTTPPVALTLPFTVKMSLSVGVILRTNATLPLLEGNAASAEDGRAARLAVASSGTTRGLRFMAAPGRGRRPGAKVETPGGLARPASPVNALAERR